MYDHIVTYMLNFFFFYFFQSTSINTIIQLRSSLEPPLVPDARGEPSSALSQKNKADFQEYKGGSSLERKLSSNPR